MVTVTVTFWPGELLAGAVMVSAPPPVLTVPEWHSVQLVSCGKPPRAGAPLREANGLEENAPAGGLFNSTRMNIAQNAAIIADLDSKLPISIHPSSNRLIDVSRGFDRFRELGYL